MSRSILVVAAIAAAASLAGVGAWAGDDHKGHKMEHHEEAAGAVTLEGEILDLYCFMKHPDSGQGAEHAKCARKCISKGLPIGLMVGNDIYLIIGKEHESAAALVADYAGTIARVRGTLVSHHGVKAIELESIENM